MFLDVIAAFYELIRKFIMPTSISDSDIVKLCIRLNFSPEELKELLEDINSGNALSQANYHPHLALLISEAHQNSWVSTEGID